MLAPGETVEGTVYGRRTFTDGIAAQGLPEPILDLISSHDSPEHRTTLTGRRLRPLALMDDEVDRLVRFRALLANPIL